MQKLKTTKRAVALLLCAVLLCFPLMGLAAPAAQAGEAAPLDGGCVITCYCTVHCAENMRNPDCPGCQTDISVCIGKKFSCICSEKCTPEQINESCPACVLAIWPCVGREPEPAPVCSCEAKCTAEAVKEDCPVCKADPSGCNGKEPEPAPACSCEAKCTAEAVKEDCPVCKADPSGCIGKEQEPAPACSCTVKCREGAVKEDCPVCKADLSGCNGKEPEPAPICSCEVKCTAEAVKEDCPICKTDLTGCKGKTPEPAPKPSYTITIVAPDRWHTRTAQAEIRLADNNGTGWQKVEAKIERGGSWQDLTDDFADRNRCTVEISENCTVYVTVTDKEGKAHTKSRYIECFDRTAPTVKVGIDGKLLRVEADDDLSGIDAIFIDGERYDDLTNGTLDVRLRDLDDDYKQISVQAVDNAGNKSKTVQLSNPNYEDPKKDKDDEKKPSSSRPETSKPGTTTPETTTPAPTPTTPPASTTPGGTSKPSASTTGGSSASSGKQTSGTSGGKEEAPAEKEPGEPFTEGSGIVTRDLLYDKATNKQFITIQGRGGSTFYIVIDYDAPVNEEEEQYTTYFLNQVDEADLAELLEESEPASCDCKEQCAAGAVNTACPVCASNMTECAGKAPEPEKPQETEPPEPKPEEPEKKNGAGGALVLLMALALAGGGAFYYIKFVKNKPKTKGNTALEDYDYGDEDLDFEDDAPEGSGEETDGLETPEEGGEPSDGEDEDL
ncbi:DUF4366 domain-containing protein [Enterocloster bolteae]|uniref:DUF4366 domain-containing protein n=2 Tax=Enterocloster bolteae TaxID=208479 RepID=UPI000E44CFA9|nr:DUF4366 domain-containing protein [Enterocloster bolteae]RGK66713.1 DUF4366 domain-containing protein [Enterocloster bolteae]